MDKKAIYLLISLFVVFSNFSFTIAQNNEPNENHDKLHWSYSGETGPLHWGELSPEFAGCAKGEEQTPIDFTKTYKTTLDNIQSSFAAQQLEIINNGHTVQVNIAPGSYSIIDGIKYSLLQFHFHTPSEHTVNGEHYPMEMHFVHKNDKGELAVIGVFFKEGKENTELQKIITNFPRVSIHPNNPDVEINPADFLPANSGYFKYWGSLTTPPCSEGVNWIVMKTPIEASKKQINLLRTLMGENDRPVMPLNRRFVLESN